MAYVYNEVPSTSDEQLVKTLAFPFQRGPTGFPALAQPQNRIYVNIVALLTTGVGERVMATEMGIDLYKFTFTNMTEIDKARISNAVANVIERFIPGTIVNSVDPSQLKYQDGVGSSIVFDIVYTVGGETNEQKVVYMPTGQGQ
jgi:phage baseplate assembly protein W